MKQTKHTPGPWRIGTPGPNGCYTVGTKRGLMTAMITHSINHADQAVEATANANLIAAAPELLDIVQRLGVYLPNELQTEVNAVIAKALGVTPNT